jgi:dTDP-4-dehydrorhamnose reductase
VLSSLARGEPVQACPRTHVSPTYVPDLCHATLDLLIDGETGIWHLANQGKLSWYEFAHRVADAAGYDASLVLACPAPEEANTALASRHGFMLRPVEHALDEYVRSIELPEARPKFDVAAE